MPKRGTIQVLLFSRETRHKVKIRGTMQANQSSAQSSDKPKPIDGARLVSLINALRKLPWPMTYEVYDSLIQEFGWQLVKPREQEPQTGHEQCMHYDGRMPLLATIENDVVTSVASSPVIDVIHQLPADACRALYDEYCAAGTAAWGWPTDVRHTGQLTGTVWKGFAPQTPASWEYVSINLNEEDKTIMFVLASEQTGAPPDGARRPRTIRPYPGPDPLPRLESELHEETYFSPGQFTAWIDRIKRQSWPLSLQQLDTTMQSHGWQLIEQEEDAWWYYDGPLRVMVSSKDNKTVSLVMAWFANGSPTAECLDLYHQYVQAGQTAWGDPSDEVDEAEHAAEGLAISTIWTTNQDSTITLMQSTDKLYVLIDVAAQS